MAGERYSLLDALASDGQINQQCERLLDSQSWCSSLSFFSKPAALRRPGKFNRSLGNFVTTIFPTMLRMQRPGSLRVGTNGLAHWLEVWHFPTLSDSRLRSGREELAIPAEGYSANRRSMTQRDGLYIPTNGISIILRGCYGPDPCDRIPLRQWPGSGRRN